MVNNMFVHYSGTIAAFKSAALESTYANSIVFISGDSEGKGAAIYTHNKYYADITTAINDLQLAYFTKISDGKTVAEATEPNSTIVFSSDANNTVSVVAGTTGIKIGLSDDFMSAFDAKAEGQALTGVDNRLKAVEADYLTSANQTTLQSNIDKKVDTTTYEAKVAEIEGSISDNLEAANEYTDSEITKLGIPALSGKVDTLIGEDANMSARAIVQDEVAKQLTSENISESFDTLKEMAEWLSAHPEDVTSMNEAIQAAQTTATNAGTAAADAQSTADDAVAAAGTAQQTADAAVTAIGKMDLTKVEGFVTSVEQADGVVTATAVATIAAEKITVADTAGKLDAVNVEAALAELAAMWEWEEL